VTTDFNWLVRTLAARYERDGRSWPAFCAALTLVRGRAGLDRAEFARWLAVPVPVVVHLELGRRHPSLAPPGLVALAPDVDWIGLGVPSPPPAGPSRRACRARHPSGRRPLRVAFPQA